MIVATLRALTRTALLSCWTALCWIGFEIRRRTASGAVSWPENRWFQRWAHGALRILGVSRVSSGHNETGIFLLVSNHLSYLDIVVYAAESGALFVSKAEVAGWPGIGFLTRRVGTIFVDRSSPKDAARAVAQIEAALRAGRRVVVFPEATSSPGEEVLPFRTPLFAAAVRSERPVVCGALAYETPPEAPPASESVCWWGDMTFPGHVFRLMGLARIRAKLSYATLVPPHNDRRELSLRAHQQVASLHRIVRGTSARGRGTS